MAVKRNCLPESHYTQKEIPFSLLAPVPDGVPRCRMYVRFCRSMDVNLNLSKLPSAQVRFSQYAPVSTIVVGEKGKIQCFHSRMAEGTYVEFIFVCTLASTRGSFSKSAQAIEPDSPVRR